MQYEIFPKNLDEKEYELSKDIVIFRTIKNGGLEVINNTLDNLQKKGASNENKYYLKSYSLNYIISNINYSYNIHDYDLFTETILNNKPLIKFLLEVDDKYYNLQKKFCDTMIYLLNSASLSDKIKCFKNLIKYPIFKDNFFLNETNWLCSSGNLIEYSFFGLIISSSSDYKKYNEIIDFIKYLIRNFKADFTKWFENLIKRNLSRKKISSIIENNKNLSTFSFLVNVLNLTIELYKDACSNHKKTIDNINQNIFNVKNHIFDWDNEVNDSSFDDFNLFSKLFAYITKLIDITVSPLIFSIAYDEKGLKKILDLIKIEETSLRWNNVSSSIKKMYIEKLIIKKKTFEKIIKKNNDIISKTEIISNIIYITNEISRFIEISKFSDIPSCVIDNISIFLNYNKTPLLSKFSGLNLNSILILIINILRDNDSKVITNTKINFLNYLFINNHIIIDILNSANSHEVLNLTNYLLSLNNLYINIDKQSTESLFYDKMGVRFKINNMFQKILTFYNEKDKKRGIFIIKYEKMYNCLEKYFSIKENIEQMTFILVADNSYYFEEIVNSLDNVDIIKKKLEKSTNIHNNLKFEDIIYREMGIISSYWSYLKTGLYLLKQIILNFPKICFSDLLGDKIVNSLNFYLYRSLNNKYCKKIYNSNIYNFEIRINDIYDILYDIYIDNYKNEKFIKLMSNDERSYSSNYLCKMESLLSEMVWDNYGKISILVKEIDELKKIRNKSKFINLEYPSEFCDPIMMTPINEPCILPESGVFIDKNTIISHLMLDKSDPFNRTPLELDDLETYNSKDEIKTKIKIFLDKKKQWENENKV